MFANVPTNVGISQRVVATLVASAVVLASLGFHVTRAQAANLVSVSNTLATSAPSVTSAHTIRFTIPTGSTLTSGQTVSITFPTGAPDFTGVNTVVSGDLTVTANATPQTISGFSANATTISFTGVSATAGQQVVVAIAGGRITNPTTIGSRELTITAGADTGKTRVAIVNTVDVTAIVDTVFNFVITGTATGTAMFSETSTGSTSPTLIPFGQLVAGTPEVLVQDLAVTTNANNGFVVTVQSDGNFRSANGAIIDNFQNGSDVTTPTTWTAPSNVVTNRTTWGHWGMISNDTDLSTPFSNNSYIAASTTPRTIFTHNGPADGTTANIGRANVGYKVQITPLQEAADDYRTTLTYIATPTF